MIIEAIRTKLFKQEKMYPAEYLQTGWAKTLEEIYQEFSQRWLDYPDGYCYESALKIEKELGFQIVSGWFNPDLPYFAGIQTFHYWNHDPQRRRVDMTGSQFNYMLWPWNKLPSGVLVMEQNSGLGRRYIERD